MSNGETPASGGQSATADMLLRRTPDQILGPFYPVQRTPDPSGDLTQGGRAQGLVLHLTGVVSRLDGTPVAGAEVQIWQANSHGRYRHDGDVNPAPLDPHFDGFAVTTTGADGRYAFTTVKPVAYPTSPTTWRPAHIHFRVTTKLEQLVTQMYFEGDAFNDSDPFLRSARRPEALVVSLLPPGPGQAPESRRVVFDIALGTG
jgi:protocatechuate 3,4-dioxygenase, beta subunit